MNIIVCCDGTWNTPNDLENGVPSPTNVVKLYNALAPKDPDGAPQKSYYHPGVGSEGNWRDRILGGSTGKVPKPEYQERLLLAGRHLSAWRQDLAVWLQPGRLYRPQSWRHDLSMRPAGPLDL